MRATPFLILAALAACRHESLPTTPGIKRTDDLCGVIDGVLDHKMRPTGEPNVYRIPLRNDECVKEAASWRGKPLVEVVQLPADRRVSDGLVCPRASIYESSVHGAGTPTAFVVRIELSADGSDAYQWHWYLRGIANPALGTCAPGKGRIQKIRSSGAWLTTE